ncbi:3-oxoacyl-[acyl-carrier-protein] reductase FabG [Mycolicibacterium vanbaalenii]|uniref:3-oxoacyl-[acyl-carrier-protein] reductase FabG n=1 Tax=Mycolicibacterium vanbaalenii TaxID=110539 RepID=A0A5S9NLX5_MYCVN|nr:glucose 1-dehydrogenase [Mycolicibacterium vanbaalenii]CAA0091700.1 3-oxoacyl-[acyl-carrier-protein] reductase FabG [Mycolicibacterium vanbaalenii]
MKSPGELFDLTGKVAVVTGSTRGLGREIAFGLAHAGADVVVSSRKAASCEAVAAEIAAATGVKAIGIACHVAEWDSIPAMVDEVVCRMGRIDVLVNNAGINPAAQYATDVSKELWQKIFSVNLEGPLRTSQCVAPVMRDGGGGSIVNIGSMSGYGSIVQSAAYGASKSALRHLTMTMAQEFAPWNVRVNILSPGPFKTEMLAAAEQAQPGALAMLAATNSQNRVADISEIVGPVLYLASDASSYVTGDDLTVSGGMRK